MSTPRHLAATAPQVGFVSLGCAKALVDSERILTQLRAEGYQFTNGYSKADVVIVNTCGFLDSAREESLGAIGEALKENGNVIVTGCMGATPELIKARFPHVSAITGPHDYAAVMAAVHAVVPAPHDPFISLVPPQGVKLTPKHYAYLKISEGCNNRCTFCIIPQLRGDLVSRPVAEVLDEAQRLVTAGVKELLIVSQDTSAYGIDIKYATSAWQGREVRAKFYDLCAELGQLGVWVRLHYVYPYPHVDEVIPLMAAGKILPYLDIPFQHASPAVLKNMKRPGHQTKTLERIKAWRAICPDLTLRSTFIVGFPGETEADFQMLLDWLHEAQIDRVGCFKYEPVAGATANDLGLPAVPPEVMTDRWERLMAAQQKISAQRLARRVGQTLPLIIDSIAGDMAQARTQGDAPEVDGMVSLSLGGAQRLQPGDIVQGKITGAEAYDLTAVLVQGPKVAPPAGTSAKKVKIV